MERLGELCEVSRSSYYDWKSKRTKKKHSAKRRKEIGLKIEKIFTESRKSYGAIRVHGQLVKLGIVEYSIKQVRRIMCDLPLFFVNFSHFQH